MNTTTEIVFPNVSVELKKTLYVSPAGRLAADSELSSGFDQVDADYGITTESKLQYLQWLEDSTQRWQTSTGPIEVTHLDRGYERYDDHLTVTLSPLNDGPPQSNADTMIEYVTADGKYSKRKAAPNSWSPVTKLSVGYELGQATGLGMNHLQVYAPELPALSPEDTRILASGDPRPYGRLVREAIARASDIKRQQTGNAEGYRHIHLVAAGMCGKAIGTALSIQEHPSDDYELASLSLQNLSIEQSTSRIALNYATRGTTNSPDAVLTPTGFVGVPEPLIRRDIDGHGAELAMYGRVLRGAYDQRFLLGKTGFSYPHMLDDLVKITYDGTYVSVANVDDEKLNRTANLILPTIKEIKLRMIYGQYDSEKRRNTKVGQLANEQATLMGLLATWGAARYISDDRYPSAA